MQNILLPIIAYAGMGNIFSNMPGGSIVNMVYDDVIVEDDDCFIVPHITCNQLRKQIRYLKRKTSIISLDEAFYLYQNNIKPKHTVSTISFDGSYRNNIYRVLPVLDELKVPAVFFVSAMCADNNDKYLNAVPVKINRAIPKNDRLSYYNESWAHMNFTDIDVLARSGIADVQACCLHNTYLPAHCQAELLKSEKHLLENVIHKQVNTISYPVFAANKDIIDTAFTSGFSRQLTSVYDGQTYYEDKRIMSRSVVRPA